MYLQINIMWLVGILLLSACRLSRRELNQLRIHSEELERLLEMWGGGRDLYAYNRSTVLVNEMVETLWYCTLE